MRKAILIILLMQLLFSGVALAQVYQGQVDSSLMPKLSPHYQDEYTFDQSTNPALWNSQKGLHVGFGSTDALYFRAEVPDMKKETLSWSGNGWKGERLNAQILVWSSDTLEQVRFKLSNLVSANGGVIS